jgi:hypothetical protein
MSLLSTASRLWVTKFLSHWENSEIFLKSTNALTLHKFNTPVEVDGSDLPQPWFRFLSLDFWCIPRVVQSCTRDSRFMVSVVCSCLSSTKLQFARNVRQVAIITSIEGSNTTYGIRIRFRTRFPISVLSSRRVLYCISLHWTSQEEPKRVKLRTCICSNVVGPTRFG